MRRLPGLLCALLLAACGGEAAPTTVAGATTLGATTTVVPVTASPAASTTTIVETTTTVPGDTYDSAAFHAFLAAALVDNFYSYGAPGSALWDASAGVYEDAAYDICADLLAGRPEGDIRAELEEWESIGDPDYDDDVVAFVDALIAASKGFLCP